jgi:hypothetical protein
MPHSQQMKSVGILEYRIPIEKNCYGFIWNKGKQTFDSFEILPLIPPMLPAFSRTLRLPRASQTLDRLYSKKIHPAFDHNRSIGKFFCHLCFRCFGR